MFFPGDSLRFQFEVKFTDSGNNTWHCIINIKKKTQK